MDYEILDGEVNKLISNYERESRKERRSKGLSEIFYTYPKEHLELIHNENEKHYSFDDTGKCPICLISKREYSKGGRKQRDTCSNPICRDVYCSLEFRKRFEKYTPIDDDYTDPCYFLLDDNNIRYYGYNHTENWKWWSHRNIIEEKRSEVMALMYLEGQIELSENAIPYLDKNYCKPTKYKQSIKRFSYETNKSNADTLRNYGWSDLLLSGITPTRSKSSKHAKHHQPG